MKILILSDIHIGKSRESTTHQGIVRQANSEAAQKLEEVILQLNLNKYDLAFHLGDLIRESKDEGENQLNLQMGLSALAKINPKIFNLAGNHDINAFPKDVLKSMYGKNQMNMDFEGELEYLGIKFIWLDFESEPENIASMGRSRLDKLIKQLNTPGKKIIFSHYPLIQQDTRGQFYFEKNSKGFAYKEWEEIKNAIKSSKDILACLSGHTHWLGNTIINGIPFIFCPSFSENIAGSEFTSNNPGIYSELEILNNGEKLIFKSFSNKFCFFNLEINK